VFSGATTASSTESIFVLFLTDKKFWFLCLKGIDRQSTGVLLRFQYFTWSPNVKISSVLDVETACQKVRFLNAKSDLPLPKIYDPKKRKYFLNYNLPHWEQNKTNSNNYFLGCYGELFMFCFDKSHFSFVQQGLR